MSDHAIVVEGLAKRFGEVVAPDGIDFQVPAGSVFVPVASMPGWLQPFAEHQPVSVTAAAVRALVIGGPTTSYVLQSLAWCAAILLVFGPIAVVLSVGDEDEAVRVANGVRYGLVASVFTADLDRALGLAARLDTGMIRVNAPTSGVDYLAPFGGEKDSSFGPREQGKAARDFYTSTRTVTILPEGG